MAVKTNNRNSISYNWDIGDPWDINDSMLRLSYLASPWVKSEITALPASPVDNDSHIVAAGSPAPLNAQANKIAYYKDGAWLYYDPPKHVPIWVESADAEWIWRGSTWEKHYLATCRIRARAFINQDGSYTADSFGIASVSKTGVGVYKVYPDFTTTNGEKYFCTTNSRISGRLLHPLPFTDRVDCYVREGSDASPVDSSFEIIIFG